MVPIYRHHKLSACLVGDRFVFLDRKADRYFCLPPALNAEFRARLARFGTGTTGHAPDKPFDRSLHPGLAGPFEQVPVPPVIAALDRHDLPAPRFGAIVMALSCRLAAAIERRLRPLDRILARLEAARRVARPPAARNDADVRAMITAFHACAYFVFAQERWLIQSVALLDQLRRRGQSADLVFGVMMSPFAAHCWVQQGGTVLNDTLDHAGLFSPILII